MLDFGSSNTLIVNNYIGTDVTGTLAIGNVEAGIAIEDSSNTTVGGSSKSLCNVISGNQRGIRIEGDATNVLVVGNSIGPDANGGGGIGNFDYGVLVAGSNAEIGQASPDASNDIAFNGTGIGAFSGSGNTFIGNSIHDNFSLGIDLGVDGVTANDPGDADLGPNGLQNYPVIASANTITGFVDIEGTLHIAPATTYTIQFYASPAASPSGYGEGQQFLGEITTAPTDSNGDVSFSYVYDEDFAGVIVTEDFTGRYITATATSPTGETSEFSRRCLRRT